MKRLVFLVEGDTERILVNKKIIPLLYGLGFQNHINCQTILTNRKMHKKGGVINYEYLKNDLERIFAQGNVIVTTLIDFFRIPTNFPSYTTDSSKIHEIENAIHRQFSNNPDLIPYIQRHELEALMFSNMDGFDLVVDDEKQISLLREIYNKYYNPEDINNKPSTSPSNRLKTIFNYDKVVDGEIILDAIEIDIMIAKCPKFGKWIHTLIERLTP